MNREVFVRGTIGLQLDRNRQSDTEQVDDNEDETVYIVKQQLKFLTEAKTTLEIHGSMTPESLQVTFQCQRDLRFQTVCHTQQTSSNDFFNEK